MGLSLSLYRLTPPFLRPRPNDDQPWPSPHTRPPGPVVWLHNPQLQDRPVVDDLIACLTDNMPDLWFLITADEPGTRKFPDHCFLQHAPSENSNDVGAFLDFWKPNLLGWIGGPLRPRLVAKASGQGIPLFLFDSGSTLQTSRKWLRVPGLTGETLRCFTKILAGDDATAHELRNSGAKDSQLHTIGVLEREKEVLPYDAEERDALAQVLTARSIWLAANVDPTEFHAVINSHLQALRRSHRSMLILAPANPNDGEQIAAILQERNISYQRRSAGENPNSETQIYIADIADELGLWYRLAPISFVGGTLNGATHPSSNPLDAAALGSAVIHGGNISAHQDAFHRLGKAKAAITVSDTDELARAVEMLLSPDQAAQMAHNGWMVSSAGADVTDQVVDLMANALILRGDAK